MTESPCLQTLSVAFPLQYLGSSCWLPQGPTACSCPQSLQAKEQPLSCVNSLFFTQRQKSHFSPPGARDASVSKTYSWLPFKITRSEALHSLELSKHEKKKNGLKRHLHKNKILLMSYSGGGREGRRDQG